MGMTRQQQTAIRDALQSKGALKPCSQCGDNNIAVSPQYYRMVVAPTLKEDIPIKDLRMDAFALVFCKNCGYSVFHNLEVLGITG